MNNEEFDEKIREMRIYLSRQGKQLAVSQLRDIWMVKLFCFLALAFLLGLFAVLAYDLRWESVLVFGFACVIVAMMRKLYSATKFWVAAQARHEANLRELEGNHVG